MDKYIVSKETKCLDSLIEYEFPNGYMVSVSACSMSFDYPQTWDVAVKKKVGDTYAFTYEFGDSNTFLTNDEVNELLNKVYSMKKVDVVNTCEECKHFDSRDRYCLKLNAYNVEYCGKFEPLNSIVK